MITGRAGTDFALYRLEYIFNLRRIAMNWQTPQYQDLRLGFEVTLYINNHSQ